MILIWMTSHMILISFQHNSYMKSTSYQNYMWRNCLCTAPGPRLPVDPPLYYRLHLSVVPIRFGYLLCCKVWIYYLGVISKFTKFTLPSLYKRWDLFSLVIYIAIALHIERFLFSEKENKKMETMLNNPPKNKNKN